MLVTFHSDRDEVTMFGDVAVTLLKMAGHSGTVPSALLAADIPAAIERLRQALANAGPDKPAAKPDPDKDADEPPVGLRLRAHPLMALLSAAAEQKSDVMWNEGAH